MKIRIRGNSIRFRLTKSEVKELCTTGRCSETTNFGKGLFTYSVRVDEKARSLEAALQPHAISMHVPPRLLNGWYENEHVGFEDVISLKYGEELHLLLEKDFVCLDDRDEDESDNYPNPKLQSNENQQG